MEDLAERVARLESYCETFEPIRIDFASIVGEEKWSEHWGNHAEIIKMMRRSQATSDEIRAAILAALPGLKDGKGQAAPQVLQKAPAKPEANGVHHHAGETLKVGEIAKLVLGPYLQSPRCPHADIDLLSDPSYSREALGMSFPILVECTEGDKDEKRFVNGHPRYYADALHIDDRLYLLTKEWKASHRRRLVDWLSSRGVDTNIAEIER